MGQRFIDQYVRDAMRRERDVIERACEAALQLGDRGVLVIWRDRALEVCEPSELVPYGQIYQGWLNGR